MLTLENLLKLRGVVAAGEASPDGALLDYRASIDLTPEVAAMAARFSATVTMMLETLAAALSKLSGQNWVPAQAWSYTGGDWTANASRGRWVIYSEREFHALPRGVEPTLDEALGIEGVVAAGDTTADGRLLDYRSSIELSRETALHITDFCSSVTAITDRLAAAYTSLTAQAWTPQEGWLYSGGDWTAFTVGRRWTILDRSEADIALLRPIFMKYRVEGKTKA